jgi:putative phage-type endonuclease
VNAAEHYAAAEQLLGNAAEGRRRPGPVRRCPVTAPVLAPVRSPLVPDGVLLYSGAPHADDWFAARRAGITATDVPAIVGANARKTAMHVWLDKRGELPEDGGPSHFAEAGNRLEPVIAQWWADDHGVTVRATGVWARAGEEWMVASPDGTVDRCPDGDGPCGLEVKNRNAYVAGQWSDDVPDDVLAQTGWQMAVTGWGHVHVAALIGGNTPCWHRVDRDAELEGYLIGEAARVWAAVLDGVPPEVDASAALARLLDALHPDRDGGSVIDVDRAADLYRRYREANDLERRGKALKARLRDEAVVLLEAAEELWTPGADSPLATYRATPKTAITADELRRLSSERPEMYALLEREGFVSTSTTRTLRWSERVGKAITDVE